MTKLVWGIPIRLFHWILLGLVGVSFYTGKFGDFDSIDNHMLAGYGIIALVLFRIIYGLFGRGHIRFTEFIKGPRTIVEYIKSPEPTPVTTLSAHLASLLCCFRLLFKLAQGFSPPTKSLLMSPFTPG